jgi:hypothetical protein
LTEKGKRAQLWKMGIVAAWYLKPAQLDVYELLHRERFPFVEESRRVGKTTTTLVYVLEELRRNEQWIWRWCEPWKYQARDIVIPEIEKIQYSCPIEYRFKYYKTDSFYEARNGSRLYLRGVNEDKGESARGSYANGITGDEYGSWRDPQYIVNEVLLAQLLSTNGKFIKTATPPRDLGHAYYGEKEVAIREGRFIQKVIWDLLDQLYSKEQIDDICTAVGGPNSAAWRREFLCEPVADPDSLIIPEWSDELNIVPNDYPRPEYFDAYVAGDSGADDNTFFGFAYYDFVKDEVVVEDEICISGTTTANIISMAKAKEREHWGSLPPHRRVYDADKQLIFDLIGDHQYSVTMPRKEDKISSIHELRVRVGSRKFKVKERCTNLTRQMKVGMWKDDRHSDFQRSELLGHLDGIAMALYLNRSIDTAHNPWPANAGLSPYTNFIPDPQRGNSQGPNERALLNVFGSRKPRG